MERSKLFISYSHQDAKYAERIYTQLTGYNVPKDMIFLDHAEQEGIEAGEAWDQRIEEEIHRTRVALFIVSHISRQSDYITNHELKPLLEARRLGEKVTIFWIRVVQVDAPEGLTHFQGLCRGQILGDMDKPEGQHQIDEIAHAIIADLDLGPNPREQFFNKVARITRREFGMTIDREIAKGENSVIYLASAAGKQWAVKARLAKNFALSDTPSNQALSARLDKIDKVQHEAFINFKGGIIQDDVQVLVSEYLEGAHSLRNRLTELYKMKKRLRVDRVRRAVSSLAAALDAFHQQGIAYGNLRPGDVIFLSAENDDWDVRIPKFRMTRMDDLEGTPERKLFFEPEIVTYLAPEQHRGMTITPKTDQYSLALLAVEMLQGGAPVWVSTLDDIKRKEVFFADPRSFPETWSGRSPMLREVLYKMLSPDPDDRYASMREIVDELEIAKNSREDCRRIAKQSYANLSPFKIEMLAGFYDRFFATRPDLQTHFKRDIKQPKLLEKLDQAILYLLNFREEDLSYEPTILTRIRVGHEGFDLLEQDYDDFGDCLLDTLHDAGEISEETQQAWRTTLTPGLTYMKRSCRDAE